MDVSGHCYWMKNTVQGLHCFQPTVFKMMSITRHLLLISLLYMTCVPLALALCPYELCYCATNNVLSCSGEDLESLPPLRTGSDVDKVDSLFITNTRITRIPDNSLPPNLTTISLSNNPISDISSDAFAASANTLTGLVFGNASFSSLPSALLSLTKLKALAIHNTLITDWNEPVLKHIAPTLYNLVLLNVGLTSWPHWFQLFPNLSIITISNNSITTIPDDAFNQVKHNLIASLDLSYSNLSQIPKALQQLTNVERIFLEGNNINSLSYIPKTTYLVLSRNKISDVTNLAEALLPSSDTLESINLKSNHLSVIPDLSKMSKLSKVDLSENMISSHTVGSFPLSVTELQLNLNQLSSVPLAIASITNLTDLDLSFNMITEILPGSFPAYLSTLDLSSNKILEITPGSIPMQLSVIDLSSNKITEIPKGSIPDHLSELDLHDNAISQITENNFPDNSSLKTLNLAGNPISEITRTAFQPLLKLQTIDLGSTDLTKIPLALTSLPNLRNLYMVNISSLTCTCPVHSELYQWFEPKRIDTFATQGGYGRCNGTFTYGLYGSWVKIADYLYNKTCQKTVITTPVPNIPTTDDGNNQAPPLMHSLNSGFFLFINVLMVVGVLILSI